MEKYSLLGVNGNAYAVMGYVVRAMKECGKSEEERTKYQEDATSSDYRHLLHVSDQMCDQLNTELGAHTDDD